MVMDAMKWEEVYEESSQRTRELTVFLAKTNV